MFNHNPLYREANWNKRHILTDKDNIPLLSAFITSMIEDLPS